MMNRPRYSPLELMEAYTAWVDVPAHMIELRMIAWDHYVDVRDNLEPGTTARKRREEEPRGDARVIFLDLDG